MKLNVVYFGSPEFSARFLEKMIHDESLPTTVTHVVTREDKPVGRDKTMTPTAVKKVAQEHGIPVIHDITPDKLRELNPDIALVYAYGKIISPNLLKTPKHGFWNIHPSLLPYYRGASPVPYALLLGEDMTGCSLMIMDEKLDHGPVIDQEKIYIEHHDTQDSLLEKLTYVGYYLFKKNANLLIDNKLELDKLPVQNDSIATFTRMLKRDDGFIELDLLKKALRKERVTTQELPSVMRDFISQNTMMQFPIPYAPYIVFNMYRALHPWPGIWTDVDMKGTTKRLKILDLELVNDELTLKRVQLEGKKPVTYEQFQAAYGDLAKST